MARMLGRVRPPWCPTCNAPPGPDCDDESRSKRQVRTDEDRQWRREVAAELADTQSIDA